jgi:hypothetical protein
MNGLLYYPLANLFKHLFFFPVSLDEIFVNWVPVLCFPLYNCVVTPAKRFRMRLGWSCSHL